MLSSKGISAAPRAPWARPTPQQQRLVASHAREEQKGEGIYFDYEPVDDAPTNPKLLEL
ncbi:hypothetical protein MNEG_11351, partial [Monoraphidium neglectum]